MSRYQTARVPAHSVRVGMVLLNGGEVSKVETLPDRRMRLSFTHSADTTANRGQRFTHYPNLRREVSK